MSAALELAFNMLKHMPYNMETGHYGEVLLKRSNCLLYFPLRKAQIPDDETEKEVVKVYDDIFNKAQL